MGSTRHTHIVVHTSATDFLLATGAYVLDGKILAHALQVKPLELLGPGTRSANLWLTLWTRNGQLPPTLDLVLTCLQVPDLRDFSVFLHTTTNLRLDGLNPNVSKMVVRLRDLVPSEQVLSVFGPTPLANEFARRWSEDAVV